MSDVRAEHDEESKTYRRLNRVEQLRQLLPLDSNGDDLYEEHLTSDERERLQYETQTLGYLKELLERQERQFIVLTGNAGHGKTHMVRRLLELGDSTDGVMAALEEDLSGESAHEVKGASAPVRVLKDLSEIEPPEEAARRLSELLAGNGCHVIVCANEGRLRDVVGRLPDRLAVLNTALEHGLERGSTSCPDDASIHVVNLNFQAAVTLDGGFLDHVFDVFLNHQGAWNVCAQCLASEACPILANREILRTPPGEVRPVQRETLLSLVRIAEERGYVLTYREVLILVAYLVTGNLTCEQVEEHHRRGLQGEEFLDRHRLLELLFDPNLSDDDLEVLAVLRMMRRMDPGRIALRQVDERLHSDLENAGALGDGLFGEGVRNLQTRKERQTEEGLHLSRLSRARRMAWLHAAPNEDGVERSERLGLRYHQDYRALHEDSSEGDRLKILRLLVRGLHGIQGAMGVRSGSSLFLVDPAYGRSGSHAAVVARAIKLVNLELCSESEWWLQEGGSEEPSLIRSVEWLDRRVFLVHSKERTRLLTLDLATFEFVMGAANGVVMREFHSPERRRILRELARHAEGASDDDEQRVVRVLLEHGEGQLTLERDDTISLEA
ncbi:MAG: hypothetical protein P1V81_15865 [Planctomycetota bacterium]|nr:hypothetical protein [Planctomycetota bacterium]